MSDPGADALAATVDWGDGSALEIVAIVGGAIQSNHAYVQDGAYTVTVSVADDDTSSSDTLNLTVNNVAPMVNAGADATINEGDPFSLSATVSDPGADALSATVDWGDGAPLETVAIVGGAIQSAHAYAQDGAYAVTVSVADDDTVSSDTLALTVNNVAPMVNAGADATISEGDTFNLSATVIDPGADTLSATVDWATAQPSRQWP